ncbi:MAG: hypothetical protein IIU14_07965 [Ruminococcus sp.]|nr:hypothetical protein [Ruminococcus sp.]
MPEPLTGVYPCYENQFKLDNKTIANCEAFSVSFDNGVEEWNAMEKDGWKSRLMTAKSVTISVTAKRTVGDAGNDAVAALAFKNGTDAQGDFDWTFPDGTVVSFDDAVINVKECGAGESTKVAPLVFDVLSNGKPTVTPAS